MTRAAISWSAGKDSCLAWLLAREQGLDVRTFLTMCEPDGTNKSHALDPRLIEAQVQSIGGTWRAARVPPGFVHPLPIINGAQRVVQTRPPMPSVRLVMQTLELASR